MPLWCTVLWLLCAGGGQYGRSSQQVLRYSTSTATQTGDYWRPVVYGARVTHPVLQVHPLQTHQNHLLQRRRARRTATTSKHYSGSFCSPRLHLSNQKYSKILKYYCCDAQLNFQHHYSSLQCHMIFINHYNTLICCSINTSDYHRCWNWLCCFISLWKPWIFDEYKVEKDSIYLK